MSNLRNQVDHVQGVACSTSGLLIQTSPDPCAQIKARTFFRGRAALHLRKAVSDKADATFTFSAISGVRTR